MSEELVILVDENDNPIGTEEKVKCHLPNDDDDVSTQSIVR